MRNGKKRKLGVILLSAGLTAVFAACCLCLQLVNISQRVQDRADRYFRSIESYSKAQSDITGTIMRQREDALLRLGQCISTYYDAETFRAARKAPAEQTKLLQSICDTSDAEMLLITDDRGTVIFSSSPQMIGSGMVESGLCTREYFDELLKRENATAFLDEDKLSLLIYHDADGTHVYVPYATPIQAGNERFHLITMADFMKLSDAAIVMVDHNTLLDAGSDDLFSIAIKMDANTKTPDENILYCRHNGIDHKDQPYTALGLTDTALTDGYIGFQRIDGVPCYCCSAVCRYYNENFLIVMAGSVPGMLELPAMLCPIAVMAWLCLYICTRAWPVPRHSVRRGLFAAAAAGVLAVFGITFYSRTLAGISNAIRQTKTAHQLLAEEAESVSSLQESARESSEQIALSQANLIRLTVEMRPEKYFSSADPDAYREYAVTNTEGYSAPLMDEAGHPLRSVCRGEGLRALCEDFGLTRVTLYNADGYTVADSSGEWYGHIARDLPETAALFEVLDRKKDSLITLTGTEENERQIAVPLDYYVRDSGEETAYVTREDYLAYQQEPEGKSPVRHRYGLMVCRQKVPDILLSTETDAMNLAVSRREMTQDCRFIIADGTDEHLLYYGGAYYGAQDPSLPDSLFLDGNSGFITRDDERCFFCTRRYSGTQTGDLCFISLYPLATLHAHRLEYALSASLCAAVLLLLLVLLEKRKDRRVIAADMPASPVRYASGHALWVTPAVLLPFGIAFLWAISGRWRSSILYYILFGSWSRGVNLFSLSFCGFMAAALVLLSWLLRYWGRFFTLLNARGETMARLITSALKYGSGIFVFFYSLYLFGLDTASVLRSLGVFSLIVGLGAQTLIKDVIAGIFLVFEGTYHVGDIVKITNVCGSAINFCGRVTEISLRTTKLESLEGNIKTFSNSTIDNVENLSTRDSRIFFELHVPAADDPDSIREALLPRLAEISERCPELQGAIEYDGITETMQNEYVIRLVAHCRERDRGTLWRKINREIVYLSKSLNLGQPNE